MSQRLVYFIFSRPLRKPKTIARIFKNKISSNRPSRCTATIRFFFLRWPRAKGRRRLAASGGRLRGSGPGRRETAEDWPRRERRRQKTIEKEGRRCTARVGDVRSVVEIHRAQGGRREDEGESARKHSTRVFFSVFYCMNRLRKYNQCR